MHRKEFLSGSTPILNQAQVTGDLTSSFLTTSDLKDVTIASNNSFLFKKSLDVKKAEKLLQFVLNADPTGVQSLLGSSPDSVVLQRVSGKEEYKFIHPETKEEKLVCKREWKKISPLKAAAWAGDNFLVEDLLRYVPTDELAIAIQQLEGVIGKKNTDEYGYLGPFNNLIKIYEKFFQLYEEVIIKPKLTSISFEGSRELDNILTKEVGIAQFKLSAYGLQEICESSKLTTNFNRPPRRESYRRRVDSHEQYLRENKQEKKLNDHIKESLLDITLIGNQFSLSKSSPRTHPGFGVFYNYGIFSGTCLTQVQYDANFINKICEKRTKGLLSIINKLKRKLCCSNLTNNCIIL